MDMHYNRIYGFRHRGYEDIANQICQTVDSGEDESKALICTGYQRNWKHKVLMYIFCTLFFGVPYLFLRWYPPFEVYFFWKKCSLDKSQIVLIKESGIKASLCTIVSICLEEETDDITVEPLRFFIYKLQRYVWSTDHRRFERLRGLADGTNTLAMLFEGAQGLTDEERERRSKVYGPNIIEVEIRSYWRLVVDQLLNPLYVFEGLSVTLWFLDEYAVYAYFVILFSIISIQLSVSQTRKLSGMLQDMVSAGARMSLTVLHNDGEYEKECEGLVPGDVIEIPSHGCTMPCDAILLSGSCIVNESALTGESVPVTKTSPQPNSEVYCPSSAHMRHTLFCGTQIIQTRYYENNKVLALVIQTGCNTAKGQLVQSIMYPKPLAFDFFDDSMKFVVLLFILASLGMMYSSYLYVLREASWDTLLLRTLDIITIVVPPTLPAAMTAGTVYSQKRLKKLGIYCTSPPRIVVSGKTKLVCFDKTGTLTEEGMDVWGVLPCSGTQMLTERDIIRDVTTIDMKSPVLAALACCHSLTRIDGRICGDPLDASMFASTDWDLEEPGEDTAKYDLLLPTVVRPKQNVTGKTEAETNEQGETSAETAFMDSTLYEIGVIRQFPFTSVAQNMSVICRVLGANHMTVFSKGAPEKIMRLCKPESIPENVREMLTHHTSAGFRVIALAYKKMPRSFNWCQAHRTSRNQIEEELNLLGLLLMQNTLKPESAPIIKQLERAKIKCVMVTGDNILTAVSVSQDCGILPNRCSLGQLQITITNDTPNLELEPLTASRPSVLDLNNDSTFIVIDGDNWSLLRTYYPHLVDVVLLKCVVFARMSPLHKTQLITALQALDYIVTMCGDGANDCGALKAAHIGISLSQTEASIAAPFTVSEPNISCVVKIIKEGRCAMVTSFGLFKFMAMYSLIQFMSVMLLCDRGSELGTYEFLFVDLIVTTSLAVTMGRTGPSQYLITHRPIASLVSYSNVIPLLLQIIVALFFQWMALVFLRTQSWYKPVTPAKQDEEVVLCWENTAIYAVSCYQYLILAFVYSNGKPHKEPLYKNWMMLILFVVLLLFNILLLVIPPFGLSDLFEMQPWSKHDAFFRLGLCGLPAVHLMISLFVEFQITNWLENLKCIKEKQTDKYILIERKLKAGTPWNLIEG